MNTLPSLRTLFTSRGRLLVVLLTLQSGCSNEESDAVCKRDSDCEDGRKCNLFVQRCLLTREADERFKDYGSDCEDAIECLHEACVGNSERQICAATCESDADCAKIGRDAACTQLSSELETCLLTCESDSDCIEDFVCVANGVCVPPEFTMTNQVDAVCERLGEASACELHTSITCVAGQAFTQFCPDSGQLCVIDGSGVSQCADAMGTDECELSCLAVASCGGCLTSEGRCLSLDECTTVCREFGIEVNESCTRALAECELDAFLECVGPDSSGGGTNPSDDTSATVDEPDAPQGGPAEATPNDSGPSAPDPSGSEPTGPAPDDVTPGALPRQGPNPIVIRSDAWVDSADNAVGLQGPFFTFSDRDGGGGSTITPACGAAECFIGPEVCVSGSLGQDDDSWGAVVALSAQWNSTTEMAELYEPQRFDVRGFSFELTGSAVPEMRFGVLTGGREFCRTLARGQTAVGLDGLVEDCWTDGGAAFDPALGIEQLRWTVPRQPDVEFDFCITELAAIVGQDVPQPECIDFETEPSCVNHHTATCLDGSYVSTDCGAAEQRCELEPDGGVACGAPSALGTCERVCGDISSCGLCWADEEACMTLAQCVARCEEEGWNSDCPVAAGCDAAAIDACVGVHRPAWCKDPVTLWQAAGTYVAEFELTSGDCIPYATSHWLLATDGDDDTCELVDVLLDDELCQVTEVIECTFSDGATLFESATYGQQVEGGPLTGSIETLSSDCSASHELTLTPSSEVPPHSCSPTDDWTNETHFATYGLLSGDCDVPAAEVVTFDANLQYDSALTQLTSGAQVWTPQCALQSSANTPDGCGIEISEVCVYDACSDGTDVCTSEPPAPITVSSSYTRTLDGGLILGQRTLTKPGCSATLSVELLPLGVLLQ